MAKITPVLWKHKTNGDGHAPIYLRIYAGGKTKYKSLSVRIHPRHWNGRTDRVRKSHPRHAEINTLIIERLADAEGAALDRQREGKPLRPRHIKRALQPPAEAKRDDLGAAASDLLAYADRVADRMHRNGQVATAKRYRALIRKLRCFLAGGPEANASLPFEDVTPQLLRRFETFGIEERGNARTTVAKDLGIVRAIFYRAIRDGLAGQEDNPFFHFQIKQGTPERDTLSLGQLRKLEAVDLEEGSRLWHARCCFLFALYAAGVRFKDVALMERCNVIRGNADGDGWRVAYHMAKTGAARSVQLLPPALRIVRWYLKRRDGADEPWLFPLLDGKDLSTPEKKHVAVNQQNRRYNRHLKEVAERAGVEAHVSFHVAKHSFANIAQRKGWDVAEISQALGHSSLKVTEQYLKGFDDTDLDDKMSDLFGGE